MKEEVEKAVNELKLRYPIELAEVTEEGVVKLKLSVPGASASMSFKVAGKLVTYEDVMKKEIEEKLRARVKGVKKVVFVK